MRYSHARGESFRLLHHEDEGAEVNSKLTEHSYYGVSVENIWQWTALGQNGQRLKETHMTWL